MVSVELLPNQVNKEIQQIFVKRPRLVRIVVFITLATSAIGALRVIIPIDSYNPTTLLAFLSLGLFTTLMIAFGVSLISLPKPLPVTKTFPAIGEIDIPNPLSRKDILDLMAERLYMSENLFDIFFVSGQSGAGKSFLVNVLLPDKMAGWKFASPIVGFSNGNEFRSSFERTFQELGINTNDDFARNPDLHHNSKSEDLKQTVIVLDQFEQFLEYGQSKDKKWLIQIIDSAKELNIIFILSLRDDFFYDLRFLLKSSSLKINIFSNTKHVSPINLIEDNSAKSKYTPFVEEEYYKEFIYELEEYQKQKTEEGILPVELQMIGFVLEYEYLKSHEQLSKNKFKKYGGVKGLLARYYSIFIDSCPHPSDARSILYALSADRSARRYYNINELKDITHRDTKIVTDAIKVFKDGGLLQVRSNNRYALAHDVLALQFTELSGTSIDPLDRDNINFFSNLYSVNIGSMNPKNIPNYHEKPYLLTTVGFIIVGIILLVRLFAPFFGLTDWGEIPTYALQDFAGVDILIDIYYIPSFIASTMCALYVWGIFSKFLIFIRKNKFFTWLTLILSITMILLGTVYPRLWPIFASIAGVLIGLRVLLISRRAIQWFLPGQLSTLTSTGLFTISNMIILFLLGFYIYKELPSVVIGLNILYAFEVIFALIIAFFMWNNFLTHGTKARGAIFLSLLDRVLTKQP